MTMILACGVLSLIVTASFFNNAQNMKLSLAVQEVSRLPTGASCIKLLGPPMYERDGEKDFPWYRDITPFKRKKYFSDKKIYFWPGPSFNFILVVVDKQSDKVVFVTHYHM